MHDHAKRIKYFAARVPQIDMGQEVFQKLCQWTAPLKYASGQREAKVVLLLEGLKHMLIHDKDLGKLLCDHFELGIIQIAYVLGLVDQFE